MRSWSIGSAVSGKVPRPRPSTLNLVRCAPSCNDTDSGRSSRLMQSSRAFASRCAHRHDVGQALGSDEEQRLLDACARSQAPYLLPIVVLGLLVGLRRSEIRLLRWWQVDVARRLITVGKTKTESSSGRQLPLNGRATAVLEFWADQWPRRRPEHYVFPAIRSGVQADSTRPMGGWNRAWQTAQQSAKIRRRLHDLRHALVTRLLENGVPFSVVATLLGWSTSTTVAMSRRYRHISDAAKRWAVETLDQLGEPATGQSTNLDVSEDVRVN